MVNRGAAAKDVGFTKEEVGLNNGRMVEKRGWKRILYRGSLIEAMGYERGGYLLFVLDSGKVFEDVVLLLRWKMRGWWGCRSRFRHNLSSFPGC